MRDAADTLEEVSVMYEFLYPDTASWSAERLRNEVQHVETEERESDKRGVLIEELASAMFSINHVLADPRKNPLSMGRYREVATELVEFGWRKED